MPGITDEEVVGATVAAGGSDAAEGGGGAVDGTYGAPCVGPTGVKGADDTGVDAPGAPAARDAPVAAAGGGGGG